MTGSRIATSMLLLLCTTPLAAQRTQSPNAAASCCE